MKNKKLVGKVIDYTLNILIVILAIFLLISMYTAFQVKILGNGNLTKSLTIEACQFSESAKSKIEAAGGTCKTCEGCKEATK